MIHTEAMELNNLRVTQPFNFSHVANTFAFTTPQIEIEFCGEEEECAEEFVCFQSMFSVSFSRWR